MSHLHSTTETLPSASFWTELRATFRGASPDVTTGPLGRSIVLLAVPMILEMLMQSVFGVVDIFFVGKLGAEAVAAVGLTESLLILVLAVGLGLSMAATAVVARRIGEKDPHAAGVAAVQAMLAAVVVSVPITVIGLLFAPELLALMGASEAVVEVGSGYTAIIFGSNATILFLFLINAIFRGAGDAVLAMKALWLANLLNIALDPLFIFGWGPIPAMGVEGAAAATAIGRGIGVAYQFSVLVRGTGRVPFGRAQLRLDLPILRRILRVSMPGMLQYIIGTASWLAIFRLVAAFGSDALAGYTIAIRVLIFALLPSWGMGAAAATLVGQNLGARQPDRAERSVWISSFANMAFLGLVAVGLMTFAAPLIGIFTDETAVIAFGAECLRIVSYTYILFAFGAVIVQAFNGAGDTTTPTWINFVSYWLLQIPLAYVLAHLAGWGVTGIFAAIAIAQATLAFISIAVFRRGYWKLKAV